MYDMCDVSDKRRNSKYDISAHVHVAGVCEQYVKRDLYIWKET